MMNQDVPRISLGESSQRSNEVMENDPILEPKHKIFLSHSGAQKEFVDHLCEALEDRLYYPFFDRRHESLPKGERFPKLIVRAAQQCEMLIVVVSDEYFMSKWPMIELSAFVQAHKLHYKSKSSSFGPKILPLFYGLSVDDLEDATMQKKWFEKWDTLAKCDPKDRIIVNDWMEAFGELRSFNGLSYDKKLKEVVAYKKKIVSYVCKSISPDIRWDDSHVQGKSNICQVILEKIEGIGVSRNHNVKVVGIYGVGGIGKTTTCHTLCNELKSQYEGKACHLEFPSVPWSDSKEFFQKVLQDLTRKGADITQQLKEGECKNILRKSLPQQRTFLAIDNVSDSLQSKELAKTILEFPYHRDSVVVVTARSQSLLELLGINVDACLEMPDLKEVDAMKLFLHHAIGAKEFFQEKEKRDIMTCVRRCYFSKGDGEGCHYHPLALKALGLQLGFRGRNPSLWVKHLPRETAFSTSRTKNLMFDILRSGFDLLPEEDQTLFMDVACFLYKTKTQTLWSRLCTLHMQDDEEITHRLEELKRKGMVQFVDLGSKRITMHDLYMELAILEAKGYFHESTNLRERMWVLLESNDPRMLKRKPNGGCWDKLIRLFIKHVQMNPNEHERVGDIGCLEGIKWGYFSNVEVLRLQSWHIFGNHLEQGTLNLEGLASLRVLELIHVMYIDGIEGLGELRNLTHFTWQLCIDWNVIPIGIVGHLPSSLKLLEIEGWVVLESDALARCHCLVNLNLCWIEALSLDLSNCGSLESVHLSEIPKLQTLLGFGNCQSFCLQSLKVTDCKDLVDIQGIDHLIGLKKLVLECNWNYKVPNLRALTELQILELDRLGRSTMCSMDSIPCQLRELRWSSSNLCGGLNLNGCNQLETLNLRFSYGLTFLAELGDLSALRVLNLVGFKDLLRLPDLSKARNLQVLYLAGCCALELHERDIQMLSELPLLESVSFESPFTCRGVSFKLDLRQRKVLVHRSFMPWDPSSWEDWKLGEWEERDLDPPPILIKNLGPFQIEKKFGMDSDLSNSDWFQAKREFIMDVMEYSNLKDWDENCVGTISTSL